MAKHAISVTLHAENLTWLKARAGSGQARSVSELLDRLVTQARTLGVAGEARSVVGTIDLDPSDPLLIEADEAVRALVAGSIGRPLLMKETRPAYAKRTQTRRG